jgi:ketosteroid isomerase-like protein
MMILSVFLLLLPSTALEDASLRQEIAGVYARWNKATAEKDVKSVLAMVHPKFEYFAPEGKQGYKEFCDRISFAITHSRKMKFDVAIEKVDGAGKEAVAWTRYSVHAEFQQGKRWVPFGYSLNLIDTFVKSPKGWQILSSRVW